MRYLKNAMASLSLSYSRKMAFLMQISFAISRLSKGINEIDVSESLDFSRQGRVA